MAQEPEEATPAEPENTMGLDADEVLVEYEAQIGALTGQAIQKNIIIKKLRGQIEGLKRELVKKRTGSDDAPSEEGSAGD